MNMSTTFPKLEEVERSWYIVDAAGKTTGRLAADVAQVLRGKKKAIFTPAVDVGDFVVVINASKVVFTGNKEDQKVYSHYTGYPSGLKQFKAKFIRDRNPTRLVEAAVRGMLPKTRQGRKIIKRLKVYAEAEHPHAAQNPQPLEVEG
jgi:large subunit ribosomal protein L13